MYSDAERENIQAVVEKPEILIHFDFIKPYSKRKNYGNVTSTNTYRIIFSLISGSKT